jgi:hypothetical protein
MSLTMAFEFTGRTLANVKDASSLIKGMNGLLEMRTMALMKEANYQAFDDGTAARAIIKSISGAVLTLYNPTAHSPLSTYGSTKGGVHLRVGETYDIYDATFATYKGTVTVTAKTNTTATVSPTPSIVDTDVMVLSGSLYKAPRGLSYLINNDTGTFQLLSRATYPELKSPVTDLSGSSISVADFIKIKNLLIARAGVGKAKTVTAIMSLAQDDALRRLGMNFKRWDGDAKTFDGSFDKFQVGDTVAFIDPDADEDRIYLVCKSEIKKYTERPFGVYNMDGNSIRMRSGVSGYGSDAYTGAIGAHYNLGTSDPSMPRAY